MNVATTATTTMNIHAISFIFDLPPINWSKNKLVLLYLNYERILRCQRIGKPGV